MTVFVDYLIKAGTPKQTVVRAAKTGGPYDPSHDFWKPLREEVITIHKQGLPVSNLAQLAEGLTHKPKLDRYPAVIKGYTKWLGRSQVKWFKPPRVTFSSGGLDVIVNPELGLEITKKGKPPERHIIKLYFKDTKPKKTMVDAATALMEHALGPKCRAGTKFTFLDVERAKDWSSPTGAMVMPLVHAEAAGFAVMWAYV
jgi:hypothetical protein